MPAGPDMSYTSDLVREVREDKDLPLKAVAEVSGYSKSAINAYECGHLPVPFDYAAGLFRATRDLRLVHYLIPDAMLSLNGQVTLYAPLAAGPPPTMADSTSRLLVAIQQLAKAAEYNANTIADGKITEADYHSIMHELELLTTVETIISLHRRAVDQWLHEHKVPKAASDP